MNRGKYYDDLPIVQMCLILLRGNLWSNVLLELHHFAAKFSQLDGTSGVRKDCEHCLLNSLSDRLYTAVFLLVSWSFPARPAARLLLTLQFGQDKWIQQFSPIVFETCPDFEHVVLPLSSVGLFMGNYKLGPKGWWVIVVSFCVFQACCPAGYPHTHRIHS